ncbi:MAG: MMPL family transporter [Casimicrobiaceae bacterium]
MSARAASIAGWGLFVAALIVYLVTLGRIDADFSAFLPKGMTETQRIFSQELREGVTSRLLLIEIAQDAPHRLAETSRELARRLAQDPAFRYVANGGAGLGRRELELLERYRYVLSDRVEPRHFETAALRAALEERLEGIAGGAGVLEKRWLQADPTGETLHLLAALDAPAQPRRVNGVWFNQDVSAALLVAQTRAAGSDLEGQQVAVAALSGAFAEAGRGTTAQMRFSSPGALALESRKLIAADAARLSTISIVLILGILLWMYRSLPIVCLCVVPAVTGLLAGIAAVNLAFGSVHGITLGFGATLLGEAVDYPSFLFTQLRPGETVTSTRTRLAPTLRMAVLTTACGSLALLFADFPGLAQLGLLTVVGILVAGAMTYWILPIWAPVVPVRAVVTTQSAAPAVRVRVHRWPRGALALLLIAVVVASAWNKQWWDDDIASMNPLPVSLKQRDRELRAALGAPDVRYLLIVSGSSQDDALRATEVVQGDLQRWVDEGLLRGFDLATRLLPSRATQMERKAALPPPSLLAANLHDALMGLPFVPTIFAPFLHAIEEARALPPVTLETLAGTALGFKTESLVRHDGERWHVVVPLREVGDPAAVAQRIAALSTPAVHWIDLRAETARMLSTYRGQALMLTGLGMLLIFGVLAQGLHSGRLAAQVMVPVIAAIALAAATIKAAGVPLSVLHLVALLLILGIGINYALFFVRPATQRDDAARTRRTLMVVSATTLSAFGMLALSQTLVLRALGITVSLGVVYSLLFCWLLLARATPPALATTT